MERQNEILAQQNAKLKSFIFNQKDFNKVKIDSVLGNKSKDVVVSKIINNSYNSFENSLTINCGIKEHIRSDMGVINDLGIIGDIDNVSNNYATVLSLLNTKSKINAKIKNYNHFGTLTWNGKNTGFVQLIDLPRLASIKKGDTIVTGAQSLIFPENINIGTVSKIEIDNQTNYFTITVRLFNDMTNLGYVYVLKNKDSKGIIELENMKNLQ